MRHRRFASLFCALVTVSAPPSLARAQTEAPVCISPEVRERVDACPEGAPRAISAGSTAPTHVATARRAPTEAPRATLPGIELDEGALAHDPTLETRAIELLRQEATTTERIIARMPAGDPRTAEYLLRLADTQIETQTFFRLAARALDQPLFDARAGGAVERVGQLEREQAAAERELRTVREATITTYARLIQDYPTHPRMDEVLYSLAVSLEELSQFERARQVYLRLIRSHPGSRFIPHSWLAFAEHAFEEGDMGLASELYGRVLETPFEAPNPVYGYALYKQAWVLYNQEDYRGALAQFVRVLEFTSAHPDARDAANMARQARRELVLPYAHVGRPPQALELFRRYAASETQAFEMLESLAELYYDTGQWPETITVYHRLMSEQPSSDRTCHWQSRVAGAAISSRPKQDQVLEATRLVDVMDAFIGGAHEADAVTECRQATASLLVELATAWHREAIGVDGQPGTNDRSTMRLAAELYQTLIARFPSMESMEFPEIDRRDWPTLYSVSYFYAELLWQMESWSDCGPAFDRVVELDPHGALTSDAAYASVLCYNNVYQQEFAAVERQRARPAIAAPTQAPPARELTALEQSMAHAFERYLCVVTESDERPTIRYRLARIYYEAGHYEEAAVLFRQVAFEHPTHELAEFAANLYLDSLNTIYTRDARTSCIDAIAHEIEPLAQLLCEGAARDAHTDVCPVIAEARCGVLRLGAERLEASHRFADAAQAYVAIARDHEECGRRDEMLWNAGLDYEAARLLGRAIQVRQALIRNFPNSALGRRAVYLVGANYHALAIYSQAADWYERFAREQPDADEDACAEAEVRAGTCAVAHVALENAVFFRLGLGEDDAAIADAELYERTQRRAHPRQTASVVLSIGSVYEHRHDWPRVVAHQQRFLHDYGRSALPHEIIQANLALGRAQLELGRPERAEPHFRMAARIWESHPEDAITRAASSPEERELWLARTRDGASEAYFRLANVLFEQFRAIRFPRYGGSRSTNSVTRWSNEELGPWLVRRFAALRAAEAAYERIAPLAVPRWQIASAARIGEMYRTIVDDVRSAPVPDEIENDEELYGLYIGTLEHVLDGSTAGPDGRWDTEDDALCTPSSSEDACTHAPLRQAADRFQFCLTLSTRVRWFDEYSAQCESELNTLDRARYPLAAELRGTGSFVENAIASPRAVDLTRTAGADADVGEPQQSGL